MQRSSGVHGFAMGWVVSNLLQHEALPESVCGAAERAGAAPQAREWRLLYAMTTVGVVLSEKVDTTLSKGVLRIFGTVCGGVLGAPHASRT